jgi:ATP-dependent RNA helicase DeaD
MEKFEKLGLNQQILDVLKRKGFEKPSEIQEKTIPLALARRDIIGGAATGSGKTLAFSSGIIQNLQPKKGIQALILTPTRELAEQVGDSLREFSNKKLNVLSIYGGVDISRQIRRIGGADVIVGTPGRILDHLKRGTLRFDSVKFLVLDEVDRMFDMGFLPDVERIIQNCPKKRQTMLFSATVSSDIIYLSKKYTKNPVEVSVKSYIDPSKLKQIYYDVPSKMKISLLIHLLKEDKSDLSMVFCNTRRNADFVSENLIKNQIHAKVIHGGLNQNKRISVLKDFHNNDIRVLICTDVAARGLDIKGVTHVYNYDIPKTSQDYIHRIGRTARAGSKGLAINILSDRDYENFRNVLNDKLLIITPEKLPQFKMVYVSIRSNRRKLGFNKNFNSGKGRSSRPQRSYHRR